MYFFVSVWTHWSPDFPCHPDFKMQYYYPQNIPQATNKGKSCHFCNHPMHHHPNNYGHLFCCNHLSGTWGNQPRDTCLHSNRPLWTHTRCLFLYFCQNRNKHPIPCPLAHGDCTHFFKFTNVKVFFDYLMIYTPDSEFRQWAMVDDYSQWLIKSLIINHSELLRMNTRNGVITVPEN